MTDEELKAEVTRLSNELEALTKNNQDLVKDKRAALTRAEKAEAAANDAASEAAEAARAESGSELDKANRRITKLEKDLGDATATAAQSTKSLRSYREEAAIANIIAANKVQPDDVRAVKAIIKMELDPDSEEPSIGGLDLNSWGKTFFAKEGKRYISASDHNGGGASGSDGSKATRWSKLPQTQAEWAEFNSLDTAERNAVADSLGAPQLKV